MVGVSARSCCNESNCGYLATFANTAAGVFFTHYQFFALSCDLQNWRMSFAFHTVLLCPVSNKCATILNTELYYLLLVLPRNRELQNWKLNFLPCFWTMNYKMKTEFSYLVPVLSLNCELQNWKLNFPIFFLSSLWTISYKTENWTYPSIFLSILWTMSYTTERTERTELTHTFFCPVSEIWATKLKTELSYLLPVLALNSELEN